MKKIVALLLTLCFACSKQTDLKKGNIVEKDTITQVVTIIKNGNKTMEKFNIEQFKKNKDVAGYWIYKKENGDSVFTQDTGDEYWEEINPKNSAFTTKNIYYPTGILKMKAVYFHDGGFDINMKEYNEQGILVKETDYDAPYKDFIPWEKVKEYAENRGIDLMAETTLVDRSQKGWYIRYFLNTKDEFHGKIYDSETLAYIELNREGKVLREYIGFNEESNFIHLAKDNIGDGIKGLIIINNPQNKEQSILEIEEKSSKQTENIMIAIIVGVTVFVASIILYFKFLKK